MAKKTLSEAAQAAKEIKKQLTAAFPNVKFSVKSEYFSMGNSVHIDWNFGPTVAQVKNITEGREYGYFDGMTDCYIQTGAGLEVTPQGEVKKMASAKYVMESRSLILPMEEKCDDWKMRGSFIINVQKAICDMYGVRYENDRTRLDERDHRNVSEYAHSLVYKTPFPSDNIQFVGIERTGKDCGLWEDLYAIKYIDLTAQAAAAPKVALNTRIVEEKERMEKVLNTISNINFINYSEKSFVVYGDTFPIKEYLKAEGGKWNAFLTHPETGEKLKGWVFSMSKKDEVIDLLNDLKQ